MVPAACVPWVLPSTNGSPSPSASDPTVKSREIAGSTFAARSGVVAHDAGVGHTETARRRVGHGVPGRGGADVDPRHRDDAAEDAAAVLEPPEAREPRIVRHRRVADAVGVGLRVRDARRAVQPGDGVRDALALGQLDQAGSGTGSRLVASASTASRAARSRQSGRRRARRRTTTSLGTISAPAGAAGQRRPQRQRNDQQQPRRIGAHTLGATRRARRTGHPSSFRCRAGPQPRISRGGGCGTSRRSRRAGRRASGDGRSRSAGRAGTRGARARGARR